MEINTEISDRKGKTHFNICFISNNSDRYLSVIYSIQRSFYNVDYSEHNSE